MRNRLYRFPTRESRARDGEKSRATLEAIERHLRTLAEEQRRRSVIRSSRMIARRGGREHDDAR